MEQKKNNNKKKIKKKKKKKSNQMTDKRVDGMIISQTQMGVRS